MSLSILVAVLFWALALICCGIAAALGGRDGRTIAVSYLIACVATVAGLRLQQEWGRTHLPTMAVDVTLLAMLIIVSARTTRFFPFWVTGLHLVAVASHLASALAPSFVPHVYFFIQGFWAIPMLVSLALGVLLDHWNDVHDDSEFKDGSR